MRFNVVFKEVFIEPMIIKFLKKSFTKNPVTLGYFSISQYKTDSIENPIKSLGFLQKRCDGHETEN